MSRLKTYQVLSIQWYRNEDWSEASEVMAQDHEDACTKWAQEDDEEGDYTIIREGSHGPVLVRELTEAGDAPIRKFNIFAESCPTYSASEFP